MGVWISRGNFISLLYKACAVSLYTILVRKIGGHFVTLFFNMSQNDLKLPNRILLIFSAIHIKSFAFRFATPMNLPGIGKSMTFVTIGMTKEGKRILEFDHDPTRQHSPIIHQMEKIYIKENKSIWQYMLQLQEMGEKKEEYASLWKYMEGETEHRFPLYNYPDPGFRITEKYSHLSVVGNKSIC